MGMGSAALADAVPYPGKATEFPARDNEVLKNKNKKYKKIPRCIIPCRHWLGFLTELGITPGGTTARQRTIV